MKVTSIRCKIDESNALFAARTTQGNSIGPPAEILNELEVTDSRFTATNNQIVSAISPTVQILQIGKRCRGCCIWREWAERQQAALLEVELLFITRETELYDKLNQMSSLLKQKDYTIRQLQSSIKLKENTLAQREEAINTKILKLFNRENHLKEVENKLNLLISSGVGGKNLSPRGFYYGTQGSFIDPVLTKNKLSVEERMAKTSSGSSKMFNRTSAKDFFPESASHDENYSPYGPENLHGNIHTYTQNIHNTQAFDKYKFQNQNLKSYNCVLLQNLKAKKIKKLYS